MRDLQMLQRFHLLLKGQLFERFDNGTHSSCHFNYLTCPEYRGEIDLRGLKSVRQKHIVAVVRCPNINTSHGRFGAQKGRLGVARRDATHFKDQCESAWGKAANSAGPVNGFWVARLLAAKVRTGA